MTLRDSVLAAILGFVMTAELAHAQPVTPAPARKELVASGVLMQPQGEFRRAVQTIGYGGGFHGLVAIGSGPASVGADGQLIFYARDRGGQDMMLTTHGVVRLHRRSTRRRPYVEAIGGIKGFSADSRIGTFSYGMGAGMQFPLGPSTTSTGAPAQEVMEIGLRYLKGGGARVGDRAVPSNTHLVMLHVGWGLRF
jgi:hypothetical protein